MPKSLPKINLIALLVVISGLHPCLAQYKIRGTVYDSTRLNPLELVSVLSTSGKGTVTNSNGEYEIDVSEKDSIWFSYLNKPTVKFPVLSIATPYRFDISLQVSVPLLKEVKIRQRNYRQDSIQNRQDYASIFNYKRPGISTVTPQYGAGAGFDVNEIINAFRFRRNRSMRSFQERLIRQEQEKYVDHRFSKALVRRLTGFSGEKLDSFMILYRPSYLFSIITNEYEFQKFIKDAGQRFLTGNPPDPLWKEEGLLEDFP